MTAAPRLLSVRLQGFKSFAERTHVAFGPGISAIVGPNGSGKSNLADALRWALGEQGRALRTRKSEDVIWAGSERRPALGMADVQLVLDNRDGLLPVEFGTVELGRRLFRSGENEYVLNRQRVRLRDLVDLLDAAHLADNAFLFIGQGMVDQALALRPEERRPLFEEVAGVRRHERRRRRAEEQLVESEANLARVEDIAGELRPQVRRLAAQAQQQASRRDAGDELAEALLSAAHTRWRLAATRLDVADARLRESRSRLAAATAELVACESAAAALAEQLSEDATTTEVARRRLDEARDALAAARLEAARHESAVEAVARDEARLETERQHLEAQLVTDRRAAAIAVPIGDSSLEHELRGAEAALADALRAVAEMRASAVAIEADRETVRRAAAAQASDLDLARRREAELERVAAEESHRADVAGAARDAAMAMHVHADTARTRAVDAENAARTEAARIAGDVAGLVSEGQAAMATYAQAAARRASVAGRLDAVRDAITSRERDGLGAAARAAGGRRIDDGLVIDAGLRAAVGTALGELAGAFVVGVEHVDALATERGWVVVANEARPPAAPASEAGAESSEPAAATGSDTAARNQAAADRRMAETVAGARGGLLVEAIRSDRTGAASMLLARAAWLPDLAACVALQPDVAAGWLLVPRDGSAVVRGPALGLGRGGEILDRRAEAESLAADVSRLDVALREADRGRSKAEEAVASATQALRDARERLTAATDLRRVAEAAEATAGRRAETTGREAAWLEAQSRRAGEARDRARATLAALAAGAGESRGAAARSPAGDVAAVGPASRTDHLAALEARVADVRATRDRLELAWRLADDTRREGERERARAEAAIGIAERRLGEIERIVATLADQAIVADRRIAAAREALASAAMTVDAATAGLDSILGRDAEERQALAGAERAVAAAREILRQLQDGGRGAEREELEARLAIEALREQLLVELAGLGQLGLRHLRLGDGAAERAGEDVASSAEAVSGADVDSNVEDASDVARLEAALAIVAADWARVDPPAEPPTPARLATLRRRFHELGAANPYALEEHAELAARLDALETQRADLTIAVERTRTLISELDGLIATQFRATFTALERAFDARFQQLFGGGFARLALTEPGDLTATGVEITARPPGKKPQALAMLSGGERALTAVALLFAMLEVRPVPFCVLDEVDAALDEANVGRFTDALRDLAGRTQFIVITHNRGTIETADALYGVTVGDDSVSRVISLRLEEATALAASDREAVPAARRAPIIPAGLTDAEVEAEVPADVPEAAG